MNIIFENNDVVVVDKSSGMMVHGDGRTKETTVADWFLEYCPEAHSVGEPMTLTNGTTISRPGVVHRLDTETSGVLILAKTPEAHAHLKTQFHDRLVKKEYRAFVYGAVKEEKGVIERPIGRSAKDFRLRSAQRGARGTLRNATTRWERLALGNEYSYLALFPETGRTHQLRVHLKAINHPIVCDGLYAPNHEPGLEFSRLALHAFRLTLTLPNGEEHTFEAPLPEVFLHAEKTIS